MAKSPSALRIQGSAASAAADEKFHINSGGRGRLRMGQRCCHAAQPITDQLGAACCGSRAGRQGKTAVRQTQRVAGEGTAIHGPDLAS